jgi:Ca2+-transporting ATPase
LTDDNFAVLTQAMAQGRRLYGNLRRAVRFYLSMKLALILATTLAAIAQVPLPFAPIQIIILELFMDLGASLGFIGLAATPDVLRRPPRRHGAFLDLPMVTSIIAGGAVLAIVTEGAYLFGLATAPLTSARSLAMVAWFAGLAALGAVMSLDRGQNIRSLRSSPAFLIWALVTVAFGTAIPSSPPLQAALHGGPVALNTIVCAAAAGAVATYAGARVLVGRIRA